MIKFGDNNIGKVYLGSNLIGKALLGNNVVYVSGGGSGTTYAVVLSLTHCTSSNSATSVEVGASYLTTITADSGYNMSSVTVMMGGNDITSQCYNASTGVISIASVTGALSITCVAQSAFNIDLAFNSIYINAQSGNYGWFGFRNDGRSLSPLLECKAGDSITFSANSTTTADGHLCFFNEDFVLLSYYGSNANPRTVTIPTSGYSATSKYIALCMLTTNFASSYITNNTTGDSWNGSTYPASKILSADSFRGLSPLSRNIPWENERGDMMNWNAQANNTANFVNIRSTYEGTIYTTIGVRRPDTLPNCFYSRKIDITNVTKNENNQSLLTFYCGSGVPASNGPMLMLIDDQQQYQNYYSGQAQERAVTVGPRYNAVILSSYATNYADCYIKDTGTNEILWSGADE